MKKKRFSLKRHLNETPRSSYQVILEGDGWLLKGKIAKKKKKSIKELRLKQHQSHSLINSLRRYLVARRQICKHQQKKAKSIRLLLIGQPKKFPHCCFVIGRLLFLLVLSPQIKIFCSGSRAIFPTSYLSALTDTLDRCSYYNHNLQHVFTTVQPTLLTN